MKYDIFISYSRKDIEFAKSVCAVLDEFSKYYSFKYFFDNSAIKSREEYLNRIAGAIVESKTLLFIASQSAYEAEFCAKELLFADKRSIPIHQYRIDDAKIPDVLDLLLGTHQYREADATSIESFVREVLADALGCEVLSLEEIKEQQRLRSLEQREQEEQKRQLQIAKEREMREKIEQLTSRRRDILAEIVECEKTLAGLNREKEFVEKDITTLRRSLGEDVQDESTDAKESGADVSAVTKPRGIKSILQTIWGWIKQGAVYYIIFNVVFLLFLWAVNSCEDETNPEPTDEVGIVVAEDKKADDCKISEVTVKQKANKVPQANTDVDKSEAKKSSNNISTPKEPVAKNSSKSSKDVENPKAKDSSKTTSAAEKQVNKSDPSKSTRDVENKEAKVAPKTTAASDNKVDKFESSKSATAEKSAKTKSYKVGDYYDDGTKKGVVFYVSDGGKHGKIVSLDQAEKQWCTDKQYYKRIYVGASSTDNGKTNTDKVMARSDSKEYPAFSWCRAKGKDWYLPAIEELKLLLLNESVCKAVNSTLAKYGAERLHAKGDSALYWFSSECVTNEFCAWGVAMHNSCTFYSFKSDVFSVRAVSQF